MTKADRANNTDLAFKLVLFSSLTALVAFLLYQLKILIVLLVLAVTVASALAPIADAAERKKVSRLTSVLGIYFLGFMLYVAIAVLLAPPLREQWRILNENLPVYISDVNHWYQNAFSIVGSGSSVLVPTAESIRDFGMHLFHQTLDMTAGLVGLLLNALLTAFLAGYFVVESDTLWTSIMHWLPPQIRPRISDMILPLASRMGGYVRGQLLVACCVAVLLATGFSLLGIRYALALGLLAGFLNLIPYIGSIITCVFAVIVALNQSPLLACGAVLVCAIEQWIESSFLVPFFLSKHTSLHPLIVLFAIMVGARLMGVLGALISVPVASALIYLLQVFWVNKINNESGDTAVGSVSAVSDATAQVGIR
ncbi:MAG TPA: AI-2E family transporter [Oculatellaceae cyanobacterium]